LQNGKEYNAILPSLESSTLHSESISQEVERFIQKIDKEHTDLIYLYGLGLGYYALALTEWLKANPHRALVILEDRLEVFSAFLQTQHAEEIINHPRIHFRFISGKELWKTAVEELAYSFPAHKVQVLALELYEKHFARHLQKIRLLLTRKTVSSQAQFVEGFYPHELFSNILENTARLPEAFLVNSLQGKFANIPAIICGAGPSLSLCCEVLKKMENNALLLAGGSTIAALSNSGVLPHFGMALDPNEAEYIRIKNSVAFETPLLYGNRLFSDIFSTWNGPLGYLRSGVGGSFDSWIEENLGITKSSIGGDLNYEALSVTTLAVSLAIFLGCNPIVFCGVDLAFTGGQIYASGVLENKKMVMDQWKKEVKSENKLLRRKDSKGNPTYTLLKWIMEAESIAALTKKYPGTKFINASEGGLAIPGVSYVSLDEVHTLYCKDAYDFRGMIHAEIEQIELSSKKDPLKDLIFRLKQSTKRTTSLCQALVEELEKVYKSDPHMSIEKGRIVFLEQEIVQEEAYMHLIGTIPGSFSRWMQRVQFSCKDKESYLYKKESLERSLALWKQCQKALEIHEEVLEGMFVRF
jgi:hypothetical protein